jgi:Predicted acetyltransferase
MGELIIRSETEDDYFEAEAVIRLAFWNVFRPGCFEHYLLHFLRSDRDYLRDLSFVAEKNGYLEGGIYSSKAFLDLEDEGLSKEVLTFGPVGVEPSFQREGVGTLLIQRVIAGAIEGQFKAIVLVGSFDYYHRFGFVHASDYGLLMEDGTTNPAFLALELEKGFFQNLNRARVRWCSALSEIPDPYDLHQFDKSFPHLDKQILPGQLE